jgi:hypothetical protein
MKSLRVRLLVELLAWCALFFFPILLFPGFWPKFINGSLNPLFLGLALTNLSLIGFYYVNSYLLIPKLYLTKKYLPYVASLLAILACIIFIMTRRPDFNPLPSPPFRYAQAAFIGSIVIRFLMLFLFSLGITYYNHLKLVEREKIKAELSYLKAQINPHFLFNTLNSIYALTVKKSDQAPESVTRLSAIMRYVITEAAQETVPLEKEISYITNYIELEELRLTSKVKLSYKVVGQPGGLHIAPLIFLPYIENAFKHGVSTKEDSFIDIVLIIEKSDLRLTVKNKKVAVRTVSNGLGMENAKMRLDLLYAGKHSLQVSQDESEFCVILAMQLA